jgi:dihydroxyacid dehydratase/phosphogluconate dehydratase
MPTSASVPSRSRLESYNRPAADSNHIAMSKKAGRRIVEMVWEDLKPTDIIKPQSVQNAIAVSMAMGCSTNAIIHLIAIGRRAGGM